MGQQIPAFANLVNASIITHQEFLGDIVEPAANNGVFTNRTYFINAALPGSFPWLSVLASNYDQYLFGGLVFQYKPSSSVINNAAGAGLGLGMVIMSTDYDSSQAAYSTKLEMENAQYTVSGRPSDSIIHPIECDRSYTPVSLLYTRFTAVPAGSDQRLYDLGQFQLATQGIPNNANAQTLGELWVSYQVALVKPQLNSGAAGYTIVSWKWQLPIATVSATNTAYFGNPADAAVLVAGSSPNPPTLSNAGVVTFPLGLTGTFQFTYVIYGASTTLTTSVANSFQGNVAGINIMDGDAASTTNVSAGATATQQIFIRTFQFTAPATAATSITFTAGTLPTAIVGADFWIQQVNTGITT